MLSIIVRIPPLLRALSRELINKNWFINLYSRDPRHVFVALSRAEQTIYYLAGQTETVYKSKRVYKWRYFVYFFVFNFNTEEKNIRCSPRRTTKK